MRPISGSLQTARALRVALLLGAAAFAPATLGGAAWAQTAKPDAAKPDTAKPDRKARGCSPCRPSGGAARC